MKLLCIDTSAKYISLAVSNNDKILKSSNKKLNRPLDVSIMPSIKKILDDTGMPIKNVDGFAVGLGPGSFTSLRVGLSTIKGLAFALNKPVVGVSSLDILAMNVKGGGQICVLCDARRDLVYGCLYEKERTILRRKSDYLLVKVEDLLKQIKGDVTFIGDGLQLYKDIIKENKKISARFSSEKLDSPKARNLPGLVLEQVKKGKWDHIEKLVPLYLYPDHCQIRKSKK